MSQRLLALNNERITSFCTKIGLVQFRQRRESVVSNDCILHSVECCTPHEKRFKMLQLHGFQVKARRYVKRDQFNSSVVRLTDGRCGEVYDIVYRNNHCTLDVDLLDGGRIVVSIDQLKSPVIVVRNGAQEIVAINELHNCIHELIR